MTKIYLTAGSLDGRTYQQIHKSKYILGSFYYWKNTNIKEEFPNSKILLDSGVFTMFNKKKPSKKELEKYSDDYINYINRYNINDYVELDLDVFYPYDYILYLRHKLEQYTGRKCIPIWHHSRGKEEFIKMCKEYDYAGIGGIVSKEAIKNYKHLYKDLNKLALSYGCRLHAMGFTPTKNLAKYGFYSCDSTSWTSGGRFGTVYKFRKDSLISFKKPLNVRAKNHKTITNHNLIEWIKYQEYCDQFNK